MENSLKVNEILNRSLFKHAQLIAGKKGISRKVAWVHILEITPPSSFTNNNDLILTTGLALLQNKADRTQYMKELIKQQAAGICVELGEHLKDIPKDIVEIADQNDFPLIVFKKPVRFVDITQDIHSLLINKQHQILKNLEAFSRVLQHTSLQSTDIQPILRLMHNHSSSQVVYYSLIDRNYSHPSLSSMMQETINNIFKNIGDQPREFTQEKQVITIDEDYSLISLPVICLGQTLAYVGIILHHRNETEILYLMLDYVAKSIAHILLRKLFLEEKTMEHHNQLINDILHNKVTNEKQTWAKIGLRTLPNGKYLYMAGVFYLESNLENTGEEVESRNQDILVLLRSLLKKNGLYSLLTIKNNQILILCIRESFGDSLVLKQLKKGLTNVMEQFSHTLSEFYSEKLSVHIGFGQIKDKIENVSISFKEAYDVIDVSLAIPSATINPFYENIGVYRILKGIPDRHLLTSFIEFHLGDVLDYDKQNNTNLLETLDEYLKCMGSKKETASSLFIHRQTLYHRLDKLNEILGDNYLLSEKRICIELALRVHKLMNFPTVNLKN
ncbi:PucR family transcriptional regulator [Niallia sp. 03091]|uniref:PucR family transcriptional regulator n=1 Tax=unclassified Niallia TaxID=2837522 RepID=UPI004044D437